MAEHQAFTGIVGHGLLLAPVCPCRIVRDREDRLFVRPSSGSMVAIVPGARPAAADDDLEDLGGDTPAWRFGEDGPIIDLVAGDQLGDVLIRIDAGVDDGPWNLLGPGFFVDLLAGFVAFSGDPDDPYPELHLRVDDAPQLRTVPDAFIQFRARPVAAAELRLVGVDDVVERALDGETGRIRVLEHAYEVDGAPWRKRIYAVATAPGATMVISAQAPAPFAERMFAGADLVAASFAPVR